LAWPFWDFRPCHADRDRTESLRLLATVAVGRVIFTENALPAVRRMNFAVADGLIVMRTAADSIVARKLDGIIVTFEADELRQS
jgi:uncharacterized protein